MKIPNVWLQSQEAAVLRLRAEIIVTASPDTATSLLLFCFYYTPALAQRHGFVNIVYGASEKLSTIIYRTAIFNLPPHTSAPSLCPGAHYYCDGCVMNRECRRTAEAAPGTGSSVSLPDTDTSGTVIIKATSEVRAAHVPVAAMRLAGACTDEQESVQLHTGLGFLHHSRWGRVLMQVFATVYAHRYSYVTTLNMLQMSQWLTDTFACRNQHKPPSPRIQPVSHFIWTKSGHCSNKQLNKLSLGDDGLSLVSFHSSFKLCESGPMQLRLMPAFVWKRDNNRPRWNRLVKT